MVDRPAPAIERVWLCYLACVGCVAVLASWHHGNHADVYMFCAVHLPVLLAVTVSYWLAVRRSHDAARWVRAAIAVIGLPVVFTGLCWLLPAVHPEPYEFVWLRLDRWLFGADLARLGDGMPAWLVEVLQWNYASFYGTSILAALLVRMHAGPRAFDRSVLIIVGTFLVSYLGYLLFPTISPALVLEHPKQLTGVWFTEPIRQSIDAWEANSWDCFPSGHAMLTITNLIILWRWARRWFWVFLLPSLALIASTVLLRYHWSSDVIVGALGAWPLCRACDWLADRDGWPSGEAYERPVSSG
jgi:membrane-associated phospholipid phosphatase